MRWTPHRNLNVTQDTLIITLNRLFSLMEH